ncbi:MAG: flagellar export chaperone FliS [Cobetia sp.]|mgnify:FL=1|uniref:flagellar export chaperone FliS n=1 Tax=unclassified Cobetia TaxID=2609414 RepID=UPI000C5C165B|nr:flagellar export chaperone FliS [Cobetia sp.]MBF09186.1 flagellar export chaperone FliS [Cobetia sp.]MBK10868.1 flagellar export chaperone FliS [Cobetia sp.]HBJ29018.1 flagellar export chaperone FliS [Cobetia sp.]|tara:strand:- start:155 stop:556 length:402 start_codon:yes stop_codon:yes gene_type:complete
MSRYRGANAYARVGVESGVLSASPHQLIVMLFEGADRALAAARLQMEAGDVAAKGQSLAKATSIVTEGLRACLDHEQGNEVATNLDRMYDYIARLIMQANLGNSPEKLDEARRLLNELGDAWRQIAVHDKGMG